MSECNRDYSSYSVNCESRTVDKSEFLEALNSTNSVEKVIGTVSGKGGAGRSLVTFMMAMSMNRKGRETVVLDADIAGPPTPMAFGLPNDDVMASPGGKLVFPARPMEGVEVMSANLLLDKDTDPVIRRDPVIADAVERLWSETLWQDIDYMLVDMSPGIEDVPLTVFQSLPVNGITIVTSPRELMSMIVAKAVNMVKRMDIPIVRIMENMNYLEHPGCSKHISVLGKGHVEEVAKGHDIQMLARIPIDPEIAQMVGAGRAEYTEMPWLEHAAEVVETL